MTTQIQKTPGIPGIMGTDWKPPATALKQVVDMLSGAVGPTMQRAVRVCELIDAGILNFGPDGTLIVPGGTTPGAFVLKTGDTMTGPIKQANGNLFLTSPGGAQYRTSNNGTGVVVRGGSLVFPSFAVQNASASPLFTVGDANIAATLSVDITRAVSAEYTANCGTAQVVAGTEGTRMHVGTRSNHPLAFYTNNVLRGQVLATGELSMVGNIVAVTGATMAVRLSQFAGSPAWSGLHANTHAGQEHMIVSNGLSTSVSCGVGGTVQVSPDGNSATGRCTFSTTGMASAAGVSDQYSDLRQTPVVSITSNTNASTAHSRRGVLKTNSTAFQYILQPNATVAVAVGSWIPVANQGGTTNNLTVTLGAGVTCYRNGTSGNITLTPGQSVIVHKVATDIWQAYG